MIQPVEIPFDPRWRDDHGYLRHAREYVNFAKDKRPRTGTFLAYGEGPRIPGSRPVPDIRLKFLISPTLVAQELYLNHRQWAEVRTNRIQRFHLSQPFAVLPSRITDQVQERYHRFVREGKDEWFITNPRHLHYVQMHHPSEPTYQRFSTDPLYQEFPPPEFEPAGVDVIFDLMMPYFRSSREAYGPLAVHGIRVTKKPREEDLQLYRTFAAFLKEHPGQTGNYGLMAERFDRFCLHYGAPC